uniref:Uncharacterized protein n=1 Tax=Leersia perrieri TaxID=77586 RepID=A0A0D9XEV2_9ORYZ
MEISHRQRLFATEKMGGRLAYRFQAATVAVGIVLVLYYRATRLPAAGEGRAAWVGMLAAEVWHEENLPGVDIFVCTADPHSEPPSLVISTVLSLMAYNYPSEKLSVYLSDDGGSILTFYALWEASMFAKKWIPFCKRYNIEPRSPAALFSESERQQNLGCTKEWSFIKDLYEDMRERIDTAVMSGKITEEIKLKHKGFKEWNSEITSNNHQPIVQIMIDGKSRNAVDDNGTTLPTLVYMAREKRPQYHHNFKAGALNSLIRVSSVISDSPIILNVDCDMYSNNCDTIRDALCFFLDEEMEQNIGYVQCPQNYNNITTNNIYGNSFLVFNEYCTFLYGHGKIKLQLQMGYSIYGLWAVNSLPTLYYVMVPSLSLVRAPPIPKVTTKVSDNDEAKRYEQETLEFGSSSPEYVIIATVALLNIVCLVGGLSQIMAGIWNMPWNVFLPQVILCGMIVITNIPIYEAMLLRKDKGRIPSSVTLASIGFVMLAFLNRLILPNNTTICDSLDAHKTRQERSHGLNDSNGVESDSVREMAKRSSELVSTSAASSQLALTRRMTHTQPPNLVISSVLLSVMAYSYMSEKISVYLSDDGCSILTFYAIWEASRFAKHWLPFHKRYKIEPRSPAAYFSKSRKGVTICAAKKERSFKCSTFDMATDLRFWGAGPA